jgi:hypothetical protein
LFPPFKEEEEEEEEEAVDASGWVFCARAKTDIKVQIKY